MAFLERRGVLVTPGLALTAQEGTGWSGAMQCRPKGCSSRPGSLPALCPCGCQDLSGATLLLGDRAV